MTKQLAQKKRIFIIDDDDLFLSILQKLLLEASYDVTICNDASGARHIYSLESFDVVISDIRLPGKVSGIELMHFFKKTRPVPVILMTGFAELSETKEAHSLGADGFLAKPFKKEDLLALLETFFKKDQAPKEEVDVDAEFCKLSIDDFISGNNIRYDIFVRISNKKYIKVAHQGENLSIDRIKSYKSKGIAHLHLKKEDYLKYVGLNLSISPIVAASREIDREKKLNFLKHTGEVVMEKLFFHEVDKEGFDQAKTVVENTVSVLLENKDTANLLDILNSHTDFLYAHSLGVSMYASMLAKAMKWNAAATLFKVSVGGMFHDIGKKEIEAAILQKPRRDMKPDEVTLYESHPGRGIEIMSKVPGMADDILHIIAQHHEFCNGTGYPLHMNKQKIHPLAKLVGLANEFCKFVVKNPNSAGMSPAEAINRMMLYVDRFDKQMFVALMRLFKITPPEDFVKGGPLG